METIPLDPAGYTGTYKLVGGQPSLDFVNTVSWPNMKWEHDWLEPIDNLVVWALSARLLDQGTASKLRRWITDHPLLANREIGEIRSVRETLREALSPLAHGKRPKPEAIESFNQLVPKMVERRIIETTGLKWTWLQPKTLTGLLPIIIENGATC